MSSTSRARAEWVATALGLALSAAVACDRTPQKPVAAAKISNPVAEASLTTVTLTPDAVRRLGIETAIVDSLVGSAARVVGGEIVVPPGLAITVNAPVAGRLLAPSGGVPVAGARVSRGRVLLRIAPLPPDVAQATRDNAIASARLAQARAEAQRTARLFREGLVSARDHERAQSELAAATATAASASGQNAMVAGAGAVAGMSVLSIPSPSDGVVRLLNAAPGQTVAAGAPLLEVMRTDRLWVRVPLYAGDARRVRRGAPATVRPLGGTEGAGLTATPVAAPPSADASAASVDLFYEVRSGGLLRPGERVDVAIPLGAASTDERGLAVPLSAVVRDMSGGSWVYERTDSVTFIRRRVEVTRVAGSLAILASGPKPGTRVVTAGTAELFGTEFGAGK